MTINLSRVPGGLGFVIPDAVATQAGLIEGTPMTVHAEGGRVVVEPVPRQVPRYRLKDLVAGITPENVHGETDWGPPVGNEVW